MAVLPGPIRVAGVIADHEFTIAFGNGAAAAAFGILGLLHGSGGGRLLDGAGANWHCYRALADDDDTEAAKPNAARVILMGFSSTVIFEGKVRWPRGSRQSPRAITHNDLFVCGEGLKPQRQDCAEPDGMRGVVGKIVAGFRM